LRQASAAIATTRRSSASIQDAVQRAGGSATVSCIYNGYDAQDLVPSVTSSDAASGNLTDNLNPETNRLRDQKLRIAYVGTLWNLTSIEPIVAAIEKLAVADPEKAKRIELVVAGRRTGPQDEILDRLKALPCQLIREGYVEHKRAIEIMREADVQCLLLSDVPEAARVVPAKTFEYLALGRRILSVGPEGEVREILSEFPQAASFLPSDTVGIADYLSRVCDESQSGRADVVTPSAARFDRRTLTRQLAHVLDQACGIGTESSPPAGCERCEIMEATI
jgi:hypothetical protein